jgi:PAS domain S-box-containing protein
MPQIRREPGQGQLSTHDALQSWGLMIGTGVFVAIGYFLAARLGLALLSDNEGVALFWPASGIAAGILIARGPNARVPVTIGVILATVAANLMSDRSLLASIAKSGCNAGEALLIAWLIERWFGHPFKLDSLRRTIGFFIAATIAAAASAVGGAAAMNMFHKTAPFLDIWRTWFLAGELGIVTFAPQLIGIAAIAHNPPPRHELIEGTIALVALAIAATFIFSMPPGSWLAFVPVLAVFPLLLWIAARCHWVLAAVAVFVIAIACVWEATFGIDRFVETSLTINDRVHVAQIEMFVATFCALVLAALFAERRCTEASLVASERRFRLTADAAPVMVWIMGIDKLCTWFNKPWLDFVGRTMEQELGNGWSQNVHAGDFDRCLKTYVEAFDARQPFSMEYRLRRHNGEYRWVLDNGIPLWEPPGEFAGYIGTCIDITERKQAEDHKSALVSELDHRVKNTLACVAAIAEQTRATSSSMDEFLDVLRGRIGSLANTHSLLSHNRWRGVDLAELVRGELAPCMRDGNTLIEGPAIDLRADSVQTVAIVLHELTTNAAKYGALSNARGRISVCWRWQPNGHPRDGLVLEWRETGGPTVVTSSARGYGISVIQELIPYELGGAVDYVLDTDGVRCKLEIPAKWLGRRMSEHHATNELGRHLHVSP